MHFFLGRVVELVDSVDSKSTGVKAVWVQVPPRPPKSLKKNTFGCSFLFSKYLNEEKYNDIQIIPINWVKEMIVSQMNTPNEYNESRVFPKISIGYYTFISRDGYVFRDGKMGNISL